MAHIFQEAVLGILHLLCLNGFLFQLLFVIRLFCYITTQTEIALDLSILPIGGNHVKAQIHQFVVMNMNTGLDISFNGLADQVVHIVQQVHGFSSGLVVYQCHTTCLGNLILYLIDTPIYD